MLRSSKSVHGALLICGLRWLCLDENDDDENDDDGNG
jgi:hypothetical protein